MKSLWEARVNVKLASNMIVAAILISSASPSRHCHAEFRKTRCKEDRISYCDSNQTLDRVTCVNRSYNRLIGLLIRATKVMVNHGHTVTNIEPGQITLLRYW